MFKNNTITNNSKFNGLDSVIKKSLIIAGLSFSTLNAGFLDAIVSETVNAVTNSGDKKVEKGLSVRSSNAELGKRRVPPTSSNSNKGATSLKLGKPSKSLIALTECTNLKLSNVILGYGGTYTYKNGFKKEKSSGFIKRQKGKVTNTCVLPSLNPGQVVYLEVNEKKFKALGNSNNWSMQCV